jgi:monoamine oxidase
MTDDMGRHEASRRTVIDVIGRASGFAGVISMLNVMGVLDVPTAHAAQPVLPAGSGNGKKVLILGAGIAGMTAAHCLRRAGYQCLILEARARSGGRNWTVRSGDKVVEQDSSGVTSTQTVSWSADPAIYFNTGPGRLSSHHHGVLGYCREFGVPLEVFVSDNRGALIQLDGQFGGVPQPIRRLASDLRGAIAALAAQVAPADANVQALLRSFGDLTGAMNYVGSARAGFASDDDMPGAGDHAGNLRPPLALADLAGPNTARLAYALTFAEAWQQAPTMLQPVGGMDAIVRAFVRSVGGLILHRHEVIQLARKANGARVIALNHRTGQKSAFDGDFVVCTIPLSVLDGIAADFSPNTKAAVSAGAKLYFPAVKVAFEAPRRWWETDQRIYGGISWTNDDITQIWYPSHGFHGRKGCLIGAYTIQHGAAEHLTALAPGARHSAAIAGGEKIHPGYGKVVGAPASVAWANIPYSKGGWIEWGTTNGVRQPEYTTLLAADGPYHFSGEHMSYVTAWQEGAIQSAHYTVAQIAARVAAKHP